MLVRVGIVSYKICPNLKKQYRKIPIISPFLIFVQKAFLLGLFSERLIIIGGNSVLDLIIKTPKTLRKRAKIANAGQQSIYLGGL